MSASDFSFTQSYSMERSLNSQLQCHKRPSQILDLRTEHPSLSLSLSCPFAIDVCSSTLLLVFVSSTHFSFHIIIIAFARFLLRYIRRRVNVRPILSIYMDIQSLLLLHEHRCDVTRTFDRRRSLTLCSCTWKKKK